MEIKDKGGTANLDFEQMLVTMSWTLKADFDLAALYELKNGTKGLCYFGEKGNSNAAPWMKLSGDEGVGDTVSAGGRNTEKMIITKLDETKMIALVVWDWGAVKNGTPARFGQSDVQVSLKDDKGNGHDVSLATGDAGNVLFIATIDNSGLSPKVINTSKAGMLKKFEDSSQLWALYNA